MARPTTRQINLDRLATRIEFQLDTIERVLLPDIRRAMIAGGPDDPDLVKAAADLSVAVDVGRLAVDAIMKTVRERP